MSNSPPLFPLFLRLAGRRVLVVGAGRVAAQKLAGLLASGADVHVVAPEVSAAIEAAGVPIARRGFEPGDLDGAWLVVSAAPREVNGVVAAAATARGIFVNAVDDVEHASAFAGAVERRAGITIAIGTDGAAPALAGLLREAIAAVLPRDLERWMACAAAERRQWLAIGVPMESRRPRLLQALVKLYRQRPAAAERRPRPAAVREGRVRAEPDRSFDSPDAWLAQDRLSR